MSASKRVVPKLLILAIIIIALAAFYGFGLDQYLTFSFFSDLYQQNQTLTIVVFFFTYIICTALSLPIASLLTLFGGAVFGLYKGLLIISFASAIGATLAMLVSRTLLRDWVKHRFGKHLAAINAGVERDGAFYIFTLRLIPAIPFAAINLLMGLTPIKTWTYYWVSQVGMLAGTAVYVNAGEQLGEISNFSVSGILTPGLISSFVLLALFPWLAKMVIGVVQQRKVYAGFVKPEKFDVNVAVIGAGSGGLVSAYIAAAVKAEVVLFEKSLMGGDCLNTGCVPSKALIRSARINHYIQRAREFGLTNAQATVDFPAVMARVQEVIKKIEPHDSVERYTNLGVQCVQGAATLLNPWQIKAGGRTITARNIIIATGSHPVVPAIPGLNKVNNFTSDTIWGLREQPKRLLVLGGGPIGSELTQAFSRLGCQVTQVDRAPRLLPREDDDVAELITQKFREEGINVRTNHEVIAFHRDGERQWLETKHDGETVEFEFDAVLLALGRRAHTDSLGTDLELEKNTNGTLVVNEYLQTKYPNIYGCGDVVGPYQFTHVASHQAWYATVNALFGRFRKFRVDYSVIPWATFIDPEVARVGLNELEAKQNGVVYEVTRFNLEDINRATADSETTGFIKVLTPPGSDTILGCTIVGYHAGELITAYISAMKHGLGLNKILGTIHIYPTLSEVNKMAAGQWKRNNAPQKALAFLKKYHSWQL